MKAPFLITDSPIAIGTIIADVYYSDAKKYERLHHEWYWYRSIVISEERVQYDRINTAGLF